jgi:hypothetical protein
VAVITGFLAGSVDYGHDNPYLTDDLYDYTDAWIDDLVYWAATPSPGAQPMTTNWPVSTTPYVKSGSVARSYFDDFYNRIHVAPRSINVGTLLSAQTLQVEVFNAYLVANQLQSVTPSNAEGLELTNGPAVLFSWPPLGSYIYDVVLEVDGPPTIDASFEIVFNSGSGTLEIQGRRAINWFFGPNWDTPVVERLEWKTDVLEAYSGKEQRVKVRENPRRFFEYETLASNNIDRVRMENLLIFWQARPYGVPVWAEGYLSPIALSAGALTLSVPTANLDYVVGGLVGVAYGQAGETAEITAVAADSVTIKSPLIDTWPVGSQIYPVCLARVQESFNLPYMTDSVARATMQFSQEDEQAITPATEAATYRGYPVLTERTNWVEDVDTDYARKVNLIDFLTGKFAVDDLSRVPVVRRTHRWTLNGRQSKDTFRKWLAARKGRLVPLWLPTFQEDLTLLLDLAPSSTTLSVRSTGLALYAPAAEGRRDIVIALHGGTMIYRRITGVATEGATTEVLALDSAIGVSVSVSQVRHISFMRLVRLDSDVAEIVHHTDELGECTLVLRSVRDTQ